MEADATHVEKLRQIANDLDDILARLDVEKAFIAAAHVQAGLDALRSMVDEFPNPR